MTEVTLKVIDGGKAKKRSKKQKAKRPKGALTREMRAAKLEHDLIGLSAQLCDKIDDAIQAASDQVYDMGLPQQAALQIISNALIAEQGRLHHLIFHHLLGDAGCHHD